MSSRVWVSSHAADRFVERVRPGLSRRAASVELTRLLGEFGERLVVAPAWLEGFELYGGCWLVGICDGVVAIVRPPEAGRRERLPVAATVLTRGSTGEVLRAQRQANRRRGYPGSRQRSKTRVGRTVGREGRSSRRAGTPDWAAETDS